MTNMHGNAHLHYVTAYSPKKTGKNERNKETKVDQTLNSIKRISDIEIY